MSVNAPKDTPTLQLAYAASYLTSWQRFIRESSIDELPQFFNILKGRGMSVIGLRAALRNQYDLIAELARTMCAPDLTGWAQINGRDELPIAEKVQLDGEYVKRLSFLFDGKRFFGTIGKVLRRGGVVEGQ